MHVRNNTFLLSFFFLKKGTLAQMKRLESNTDIMNMLHLPSNDQKEDLIVNYQTRKYGAFGKLFRAIVGLFLKGTSESLDGF